MTIERFAKDSEYFFLSNMAPVPGGVEIEEGIRVASAENAYQAMKFDDESLREQVYAAPNGYEAKKLADRLVSEGAHVREDWEESKLDIMRNIVERKFVAGSRMAKMLLRTEDEELVEGNNWGDTYWGVSPVGSHNGQNWLGRLLMDRRQVLREIKENRAV